MRLSYQTITWGGVVGHPVGVTSIKDLFYMANGSTEEALQDVAAAGYEGVEIFDGNLREYEDDPAVLKKMLADSGPRAGRGLLRRATSSSRTSSRRSSGASTSPPRWLPSSAPSTSSSAVAASATTASARRLRPARRGPRPRRRGGRELRPHRQLPPAPHDHRGGPGAGRQDLRQVHDRLLP